MAIRGPLPPGPTPLTTTAPVSDDVAGRVPVSPLQQRLVDVHLATTATEARAVLQQILALLAGAGFPVPPTGTADQQLTAALRRFQKDAGLPLSGTLDARTVAALQHRGLAPASERSSGRSEAPDPIPRSSTVAVDDTRFVGGGPTATLVGEPLRLATGIGGGGGDLRAGAEHNLERGPEQRPITIETSAVRARLEHERPGVALDLSSMLAALRAAGFAGAGRGRDQLADAVKKLQRADGLDAHGRIDAPTASALQRRGVVDAAAAQALREQDPAWKASAAAASPSPALPPSLPTSVSTDAVRTVRPSARDSAVALDGTGSGKGGPTTLTADSPGHAADGGTVVACAVVTGAEAPGGDDGDGEDDRDERGDRRGLGRDIADDEQEGRHGNANVDAEDDAGAHWRAPSLTAQIERALRAVRRDDDGRGAATYRLELRLVRPGVYTAGQPAPELLRVVVERAGPFDDAWPRALDAWNARLRALEPQARPFSLDDVRAALRRARYRVDPPR